MLPGRDEAHGVLQARQGEGEAPRGETYHPSDPIQEGPEGQQEEARRSQQAAGQREAGGSAEAFRGGGPLWKDSKGVETVKVTTKAALGGGTIGLILGALIRCALEQLMQGG